MTHLSPDGGAMSQPPSPLTRPSPAGPALPHPLDRQVLTLKISCRRVRLAELEAEMIGERKERTEDRGGGVDS